MTSGDKERLFFPVALLGLDFGFQSLSFLAAILIIAPCVEKPSLFQMVLKTILSAINRVLVLPLLRISIFSYWTRRRLSFDLCYPAQT